MLAELKCFTMAADKFAVKGTIFLLAVFSTLQTKGILGALIPSQQIVTSVGLPPESLPQFVTSGRTFRIVTRDTVVLPCDVNQQGNYLLVWKRGTAVLTAGNTKVTPDPRIRLVEGYNLEIREVQTNDGGTYVCQLGTLHPEEISHTLEILIPPKITSHSNEQVEVRRGMTVNLQCAATGTPQPTITWTRKNNLLPNGNKSVEGTSIAIEKANRHHAGVYECTASNGVGQPVTHTIALHVLYPPEIEVERGWVHSGEGYEAQLVCIVHAEPSSEVLWYRDTLRIDPSERHIMEVRGSRHSLILHKVTASDFGNYSCVADNTIGKSRAFIELSGKPHPAIFRSPSPGKSAVQYNLTWDANSYTPIEEFQLYFRKISGPEPGALEVTSNGVPRNQESVYPGSHQYGHDSSRRNARNKGERYGPGDYRVNRPLTEMDPIKITVTPSEQFSHTKSYVFTGLEPGAHYEAMVLAKNRFGWGRNSEVFKFETSTEDNNSYLTQSPPASAVSADNEIRGSSSFGLVHFFSNAPSTSPSVLTLLLAVSTLLFACCW